MFNAKFPLQSQMSLYNQVCTAAQMYNTGSWVPYLYQTSDADLEIIRPFSKYVTWSIEILTFASMAT